MSKRFSSGKLSLNPEDCKPKWQLNPKIAYLNHGSFGATPTEVLEHQQELRAKMEWEPVQFMMVEYPRLQWEAKQALARLVGAEATDIALVENATAGVNAVLQSLAFQEGEEILFVDQVYGACRVAAEWVANRRGLSCRTIELPCPVSEEQEIVEQICQAWTPRVKLLLLDHICSPTGWTLPIEDIVQFYESRGTMVLVDGAHAVGQIPLSLTSIGASFYVSNAHKWLCSPKGCAFLHVRKDRQDTMFPTSISHHANYDDSQNSNPAMTRFQLAFSWTGTRDMTAMLCLPKSIAFMETLHPDGLEALMKQNTERAQKFCHFLSERFSEKLLVPDSMIGHIGSIFLPDDLDVPAGDSEALVFGQDPLWLHLFQEYGIEVVVHSFKGRRMLRFSIQAYVSDQDLNRLLDGLDQLQLS